MRSSESNPAESLRLGPLRYLYVGTARFAEDLAFYREVLGAELVWHFRRFGAEVAAVRLGEGPLYILADHRPAKSTLPIYAVEDLEAFRASAEARGLKGAHSVETPDGPCLVLHDPTGNELGALEEVRPRVLEGAWRTSGNTYAVKGDGSI
ncbi:MAG: VOC family protein [Hyalangium sp.]|uniref:VOC family protein n=1 Tax=Hyalangium sp. TaxID=2028555 RepID=UPI00389A4FF0